MGRATGLWGGTRCGNDFKMCPKKSATTASHEFFRPARNFHPKTAYAWPGRRAGVVLGTNLSSSWKRDHFDNGQLPVSPLKVQYLASKGYNQGFNHPSPADVPPA